MFSKKTSMRHGSWSKMRSTRTIKVEKKKPGLRKKVPRKKLRNQIIQSVIAVDVQKMLTCSDKRAFSSYYKTKLKVGLHNY